MTRQRSVSTKGPDPRDQRSGQGFQKLILRWIQRHSRSSQTAILETHTELNAVALDSHESDPEVVQ